MVNSESLMSCLKEQLGEQLLSCSSRHGEVTIEVPASDIKMICHTLRDSQALAFDVLIDCCGVDYATYGLSEWQTDISTDTGFSRGVKSAAVPEVLNNSKDPDKPRFAVVYHLLSVANNQRLRVRSYPPSNEFPMIDSVHDVWSGVNWFEREAFDLFGIVFNGHPDLRRILSDYGFIGHPFRKDYPLSGHVEMRYDAEKGRVIYQPVSIEPRVLVPRVIRHDHRYEHGQADEESSNA